jgi:2-aminoadipate transaminase
MLRRACANDSSLHLADWTLRSRTSAGQSLMAAATHPNIISFALGLPSADLFPSADFATALQTVIEADSRSLQYGSPFEPLKTHITRLMRQRGVECTEDQVFLTCGAQQGISLVLGLLVDRGKTALCEDYSYFGFQQAMQLFDSRIVTVPSDIDTGLDVDAVESLLKRNKRPSLIYVVPDGHNPLGVTLDAAKRARLVELTRHYGVPILEDDPYGLLFYETPIPPLRSLDEDWVIYIGSFSKIIAPALRLGWLVAPRGLMRHLPIAKAAYDVDTSSLSQRAASSYLDASDFSNHLAGLRDEYRLRRDSMLRALGQNFPQDRWSVPTSGFYVWLELRGDVDTTELLTTAINSARVAYVPGSDFRAHPSPDEPRRSLRLSFSTCAPSQIEEGIARLREVIEC